MNTITGRAITDAEHIRQSITDILTTPLGSRVMRRDYGSLLFQLIDQPQNPALKLKLMSASYGALMRWEPRVVVEHIAIDMGQPGGITLQLRLRRADSGELFNTAVLIGGSNAIN